MSSAASSTKPAVDAAAVRAGAHGRGAVSDGPAGPAALAVSVRDGLTTRSPTGVRRATPFYQRGAARGASPAAKTCVLCPMNISDRSPQASFCLGCVRIIRRKHDRERGRMARRGLVLLPRCPRCDAARTKMARYCPPCTRVLRAESLRRYYLVSAGAAQIRYGRSPKGKLARASYAERHADAVAGYKRSYAERHAMAGTRVACASIQCTGSFIREARGGARRFCDECQLAFYGSGYRRRLARLRRAA